MTDYPVFNNPPIVEALLDIQVVLPDNTTVESLARVQRPVQDRYPQRQERKQWQISAVALAENQPEVSQSSDVVGYMFLPAAPRQDRIFQSLRNSFTFSKLKPYETWKSFRAEAKELWNVYAQTLQPTQVKRLGLRTINNLNLPLPFSDFNEYLLTGPEVAPGLTSGLSQFFMQVTIPQPGGELAIVTSTMLPLQEISPPLVNVIFDIDVFLVQDYVPDADEIWERFESLRRIRNEIFFQSLTNKAKELF